MIRPVEGYAVRTPLGIDVKTVSPTKRAAQVNWLVACAGIMVSNSATTEQIDSLFEAKTQDTDTRLVAVLITEIE